MANYAAVKNPQQRAEEQAKNGFEKEGRDWAIKNQSKYCFTYQNGTVGDKKVYSLEDHRAGKFTKGDLILDFGLLEFVISQKQARSNDRKINVPARIYKELGFKTLEQSRYLILDTNEIKEARNGTNKYLVYRDDNYGGYYLYCKNDLLNFQASEVYTDPEGGNLNLDGKYQSKMHEKMNDGEGEIKRKNLIEKTWLCFDTFAECMEWLYTYIIEPDLNKEKRKQELLDWLKIADKNNESSFYKTVSECVSGIDFKYKCKTNLTDSKAGLTLKKDILFFAKGTPKIFNDEIVHTVDLTYDDYLLTKHKFGFHHNLDVSTYVQLRVKEAYKHIQNEFVSRLSIYQFGGKQQTNIKIMAPSAFKVPNATRKEAITCELINKN
ncbi:hypothetical protein QYF48_16285 [Brevibacillus agri]|uniref:hypothetical protein n=1 Tax=Brevibacillus agri TaxID=51101 RepID=UPI0025B6BD66|nr:hypothetical protein [Brevibacillus agri]MDN4094368.1 hypothetical protein [Brevibacillus agri]